MPLRIIRVVECAFDPRDIPHAIGHPTQTHRCGSSSRSRVFFLYFPEEASRSSFHVEEAPDVIYFNTYVLARRNTTILRILGGRGLVEEAQEQAYIPRLPSCCFMRYLSELMGKGAAVQYRVLR